MAMLPTAPQAYYYGIIEYYFVAVSLHSSELLMSDSEINFADSEKNANFASGFVISGRTCSLRILRIMLTL